MIVKVWSDSNGSYARIEVDIDVDEKKIYVTLFTHRDNSYGHKTYFPQYFADALCDFDDFRSACEKIDIT